MGVREESIGPWGHDLHLLVRCSSSSSCSHRGSLGSRSGGVEGLPDLYYLFTCLVRKLVPGFGELSGVQWSPRSGPLPTLGSTSSGPEQQKLLFLCHVSFLFRRPFLSCPSTTVRTDDLRKNRPPTNRWGLEVDRPSDRRTRLPGV